MPPIAGEPRLMADCMLGRLTRWLRILGFDTAYSRAIHDDALIQRCRREGRALLTRDRALAARRALRGSGIAVVLVESDNPEGQLVQVLRELGLSPDTGRLLSRCLECNALLEDAPRDEVAGRVPSYVWETQRRFSRCPECARIYWRATHVQAIRERLDRLERRA